MLNFKMFRTYLLDISIRASNISMCSIQVTKKIIYQMHCGMIEEMTPHDEIEFHKFSTQSHIEFDCVKNAPNTNCVVGIEYHGVADKLLYLGR